MTDPENGIIHRELDTEASDTDVKLVKVVADIEGKDPLDLSAMYNCVGDILHHLFSDPPSQEAQMQVEFSYEGYRITIEQTGHTTLVKSE